jgi:F-type H+-transporting ATPase subunit gamma
MPSLKSLRLRIKTVKGTRQITKTMKLVAAAKMRRARESCERARPYAEALGRVLRTLAVSNARMQSAPLLLRGRDDVRVVRLLVFGSDRGLCGGFNTHLTRLVEQKIAEFKKQGKQVQIVTLGRKARDELKTKYGEMIVDSYDNITRYVNYDSAQIVGTQAVEDFEAGKCDEVHMIFNTFVSVLKQVPTLTQLVPFRAENEAGVEMQPSVEYEPEEEALLAELLPRNVSVQIFRALLESYASEQGARMSAMESATRNAGEMIKKLSLTYNRSRQASITKELIEIISGAEAV